MSTRRPIHAGDAQPVPSAQPRLERARLLDTEQAAQFLGLSKRTLENKRVSGIDPIPFVKCGRAVRYDPRDLESWLDARRFKNTGEAHAARLAA